MQSPGLSEINPTPQSASQRFNLTNIISPKVGDSVLKDFSESD